MSFKENYIDPNGWEQIEVKKFPLGKIKKYLKKWTKWVRLSLAAIFLAASTSSAENIDISKLPQYAGLWHWLKKHIHVSYDRTATDGDNHYDTDYYERYNPKVKDLENTKLKGINNLNVSWWVLYANWQKLSLVEASSVSENKNFLKEYDLDEVVIRINWTPFKAKPKFLKLKFQASGRKWIVGYEIGKTITLVYVSYLDKIKVLGTIDNYAWYIEEDKPREYEIPSVKKILYKKILSLLKCNSDCYIKKDSSWNIYFYSNWRLVWTLNNIWDGRRDLIKWNKVLATIKQYRNNVIMTDSSQNVLYNSNKPEILDIKLPPAGERIVLAVKN